MINNESVRKIIRGLKLAAGVVLAVTVVVSALMLAGWIES